MEESRCEKLRWSDQDSLRHCLTNNVSVDSFSPHPPYAPLRLRLTVGRAESASPWGNCGSVYRIKRVEAEVVVGLYPWG
jgi:hypothetical protein